MGGGPFSRCLNCPAVGLIEPWKVPFDKSRQCMCGSKVQEEKQKPLAIEKTPKLFCIGPHISKRVCIGIHVVM